MRHADGGGDDGSGGGIVVGVHRDLVAVSLSVYHDFPPFLVLRVDCCLSPLAYCCFRRTMVTIKNITLTWKSRNPKFHALYRL